MSDVAERQPSASSMRREAMNANARMRLHGALPPHFPEPVLIHALTQRWIPPTPRLAVQSYWRTHAVRADRLARQLAARSGVPDAWRWRPGEQGIGSAAALPFRTPPAPYRDAFQAGSGHCCVCGQPVYRYGWHRDLWGTGHLNPRARWHAVCVVAWKVWTEPGEQLRLLSRMQQRRCAITNTRLLRTAEVDHKVPLFRVRHLHDVAWPDLLAFWGFPNLQAVNRDAHRSKTVAEAATRRAPAAVS